MFILLPLKKCGINELKVCLGHSTDVGRVWLPLACEVTPSGFDTQSKKASMGMR